MKMRKKIERWCMEEGFLLYAQERARKEACEVAESHRIDPKYEKLEEAFEYDDKYIVPLVAYLTYKLHLAVLERNARKRKRDIWWVFARVELLGFYVKIFPAEFADLLVGLRDMVMPMLHEEYIRRSLDEKNNRDR